jgi:hypothetical protein
MTFFKLIQFFSGINIFVNSYELLFNLESDGIVVDVVNLNQNC